VVVGSGHKKKGGVACLQGPLLLRFSPKTRIDNPVTLPYRSGGGFDEAIKSLDAGLRSSRMTEKEDKVDIFLRLFNNFASGVLSGSTCSIGGVLIAPAITSQE
jgi:hypothetical protein